MAILSLKLQWLGKIECWQGKLEWHCNKKGDAHFVEWIHWVEKEDNVLSVQSKMFGLTVRQLS